jgi:hypothetical protein
MSSEEGTRELVGGKKESTEKAKLATEKGKSAAKDTSDKRERSPWSYRLVVIMLGILGILVILLLIIPWVSPNKDLVDYYKYSLGVLLGAFGAWIGAGAAYFFGKENLQESSRSTENALKIQQGYFRRLGQVEQIKDMPLTAMNQQFFFHYEDQKETVREKLARFKGYWFVPVVEKDTGILKDIIHAQVFWDSDFAKDAQNLKVKGAPTLKEMVAIMDQDESYKKFHGELFYIKVSLDDKIKDVYNLISQKDVEVVIVVDETGKPSHCLSKSDLRTLLNV